MKAGKILTWVIFICIQLSAVVYADDEIWPVVSLIQSHNSVRVVVSNATNNRVAVSWNPTSAYQLKGCSRSVQANALDVVALVSANSIGVIQVDFLPPLEGGCKLIGISMYLHHVSDRDELISDKKITIENEKSESGNLRNYFMEGIQVRHQELRNQGVFIGVFTKRGDMDKKYMFINCETTGGGKIYFHATEKVFEFFDKEQRYIEYRAETISGGQDGTDFRDCKFTFEEKGSVEPPKIVSVSETGGL